jgi:hypothetical protein
MSLLAAKSVAARCKGQAINNPFGTNELEARSLMFQNALAAILYSDKRATA